MAHKSTGRICAECKQTIAPEAPYVRIASGEVHGECYRRLRQTVNKMIADAEAAGTHGPGIGNVCSSCGNFRPIYHRSVQDGAPFCFPCAMKLGEIMHLTPAQLARYSGGKEPNPCPDDPDFPAKCFEEIKRRERMRAVLNGLAAERRRRLERENA